MRDSRLCRPVDAREIFIYLRDEYAASREILTRELAALAAADLIAADNNGTAPLVELRRGLMAQKGISVNDLAERWKTSHSFAARILRRASEL